MIYRQYFHKGLRSALLLFWHNLRDKLQFCHTQVSYLDHDSMQRKMEKLIIGYTTDVGILSSVHNLAEMAK